MVQQGGSALLYGDFGKQAITTARKYPEELFRQLDEDWQLCARQIRDDGLGLLIPPVLGIVLTRSARRNAIPAMILDLRNEWSDARRKVWALLDRLRTARTLKEALEIRRELSQASDLFTPHRDDIDSRPIRALWEIVAAAGAGAGIAGLSGGNLPIGAATVALAQLARTVPTMVQDFGPALFGRGAFDLARRVRREASRIEFDALSRLLTGSERKNLGLA